MDNWQLSRHFNASEWEGEQAFLAGQPLDSCPYGDVCLSAIDWRRAWKRAEYKEKNR